MPDTVTTPADDRSFDQFQQRLIRTCEQKKNEWQIPLAELAGLMAPQALWSLSFGEYCRTLGSANRKALHAARSMYEQVLLRFIRKYLLPNQHVDSEYKFAIRQACLPLQPLHRQAASATS